MEIHLHEDPLRFQQQATPPRVTGSAIAEPVAPSSARTRVFGTELGHARRTSSVAMRRTERNNAFGQHGNTAIVGQAPRA